LIKCGYGITFIGPEPACGISDGIARWAIRDRSRNYVKLWKCIN
jgi:hypothetical protein